MESKLVYGEKPFVCPSLSEQAILAADPEALRLLLILAQDRGLWSAPLATLAERAGLSGDRTKKALTTLAGLGVLAVDLSEGETGKKPSAPKTADKKTKVSELPAYTDAEFSALLETKTELADLITQGYAFGGDGSVSVTLDVGDGGLRTLDLTDLAHQALAGTLLGEPSDDDGWQLPEGGIAIDLHDGSRAVITGLGVDAEGDRPTDMWVEGYLLVP